MPVLSPTQFLAQIGKQPLAPAYLFLGPEAYYRRLCRETLLGRALPAEARAEGLTQVDLEESSLGEVLDDARSLSLFAADRVIWITSAEVALPRRATASDSDDDETPQSGLAAYLKQPTTGTVLVFECSRWDFSGDDRQKVERVHKFYSCIPVSVEFRSLTPESSRFLAQELAKKQGLKLGGQELAMLLDAVAGDASRLAAELEKLALYTGAERPVTIDDLRTLVPNAAQSTIFQLVNALGKRDRTSALRSLNILVREGEYLPLALTFLSTQFRVALAAKEARVCSPQQAQSYFNRIGVRIWRERAEQVAFMASLFSHERLMRAVALIYDSDKKFREGYRDDHLIMERLVLALTAPENAFSR